MITEEKEAHTQKEKQNNIKPIPKLKTNKLRNKANQDEREKAKQVPRRSPGCQGGDPDDPIPREKLNDLLPNDLPE